MPECASADLHSLPNHLNPDDEVSRLVETDNVEHFLSMISVEDGIRRHGVENPEAKQID